MLSSFLATLSLFLALRHHERDRVAEVAPTPEGHRADPDLVHASSNEPVEHLFACLVGDTSIHGSPTLEYCHSLVARSPAALATTTTEPDTGPALTACSGLSWRPGRFTLMPALSRIARPSPGLAARRWT